MKGKIISDEFIFSGDGRYYRLNEQSIITKTEFKRNDDVIFTPKGEFATNVMPISMQSKFKSLKNNFGDDKTFLQAKKLGLISAVFLFIYHLGGIFGVGFLPLAVAFGLYLGFLYFSLCDLEVVLKEAKFSFKFKMMMACYIVYFLMSFYGAISFSFESLYSQLSQAQLTNRYFILGILFLCFLACLVLNFLIYKEIAFSFDSKLFMVFAVLGVVVLALKFEVLVLALNLIHILAWFSLDSANLKE